MNQSLDIRWRQRFEHFGMILDQLSDAHTKTVNTMITVEIAGWIHIFDLTFELAWKTLRDYMIEQQETERMDFTREVLEVALMR